MPQTPSKKIPTASTTPKKVGRPTAYKPEYCELLAEHLKNGHHMDTFGAVVGASRSTVYKWLEEHEEFSDTQNRFLVDAQFFWEKMGMAGAAGKIKGFNVTAWIFIMKNRFKWRDKWDIDLNVKSLQGQLVDALKDGE